MQGRGWVSNSNNDENIKVTGWSPFYERLLHRDSCKTPRTKYTKPDLHAFQPPEHTASNVCYRTYNSAKEVNTYYSVNTMTVYIADMRAIHIMIRGICVAVRYYDCRIG
jgi:hypothetical protein